MDKLYLILTLRSNRNGAYRSSLKVWSVAEFFNHDFKNTYLPQAYYVKVDSDEAPTLLTKKYLKEHFDAWDSTPVFKRMQFERYRR